MGEYDKVKQVVDLIITRRNRELTPEEHKQLDQWIQENPGHKQLYKKLSDERHIPGKMSTLSRFDADKAYREFVRQAAPGRQRSLSRRLLRYAAILIPLIAASYFTLKQTDRSGAEPNAVAMNVQPGTSKALLVLSNGKTLHLEKEEFINTGEEEIKISNNRKEVVYNPSQRTGFNRRVKFNTLVIPRGGEYQLTLSDGTKIWLNSESEIRYPVAFRGTKREVYLWGEAYFQVAENSKQPFIVHTMNTAVQVVGTSFNIRAYSDEVTTATTLVSGRVVVSQNENQQEYILEPGQQAVTGEKETVVKAVEVAPYIAWKEGRILFEEHAIEAIFRDLSRWYDIDVEYRDPEVKDFRYSMEMQRYENLGEVLEILALTKRINFDMKDDKLLVLSLNDGNIDSN
ncbi:MAG: FecR domain-containing protein [Bacteroidota bacterium]